MKCTLTPLAATWVLLLFAPAAHAGMVFPGESFNMAGTAMQTSGANCCSSGTFTGMFTIGSKIDSTTEWTVTAFSLSGCQLGINSCSSVVWSFTGLEFDVSNDTLLDTPPGTFVSAPFTGSGGDSRLFEVFFVDGNTTDSYSNLDLSRPDGSNDKFGTISYSLAPVPEPSSVWLVAIVLGLIGLATAPRFHRSARGPTPTSGTSR